MAPWWCWALRNCPVTICVSYLIAFFSQELKVPTLAYGHAMFQSYDIVSVLESVADSKTPNTRLVIMVSPAWFASGGQLPRSAFAEHVTGPVWDRLWSQPNTRTNADLDQR